MAEELKTEEVVNQKPQIPTEVWMLWVTHDCDGSVVPGHWLPAMDEPGTLCHLSEEEALESSKHQEALYSITSRPVRVI